MDDNMTDDRPVDVGFDAPDDNKDLMPLTSHYYDIDPHKQYIQYVVMTLVGANVVGLGGQVQGEVMLKLIQSPLLISLGMFCRLALMPALLLGITSILKPTKEVTMSLLCLLMAPSEGASSLLVVLAEADVDLFLSLTCFNGFTATAILPLWTILFERELYGHPGHIAIPFMDMFIIFFIILGASFLGYLLRRKWPDVYDSYWLHLPLFSVFTMLCIIAMEIYRNYFIFTSITVMRFVCASALAATGFLLGAAVAYMLRQSQGRLISIALETGVRTSYITNLCVTMTYPLEQARTVKTTPVLCSLLTLLPTFVVVMVYRIRSKCKMLKEEIAFHEEHLLAKECLTMMKDQNQNGDIIEERAPIIEEQPHHV